jgi:DNA polymerase I-like protein with 3'-5' exonuclease and polymerase domains
MGVPKDTELEDIVSVAFSQTQPAAGALSLRSCLFPIIEGHCVVAADFTAIELAVLAKLARCQPLADAIASGDVYSRVALAMQQPLAQRPGGATCPTTCSNHTPTVSAPERSRAKRGVYAVLYGGSASGDDRDAATAFLSQFPNVGAWLSATRQLAAAQPFVVTASGRVRHRPHGVATSRWQRMAVSALVQGLASDVQKAALTEVAAAILRARAAERQSNAVASGEAGRLSFSRGARLVHAMHDEILVSVEPRTARADASTLAAIMARAGTDVLDALCGPLPTVRLSAAAASGPSWGELHPVEP